MLWVNYLRYYLGNLPIYVDALAVAGVHPPSCRNSNESAMMDIQYVGGSLNTSGLNTFASRPIASHLPHGLSVTSPTSPPATQHLFYHHRIVVVISSSSSYHHLIVVVVSSSSYRRRRVVIVVVSSSSYHHRIVVVISSSRQQNWSRFRPEVNAIKSIQYQSIIYNIVETHGGRGGGSSH
jgi:hypothetical protein